jgi:hypothetical protein
MSASYSRQLSLGSSVISYRPSPCRSVHPVIRSAFAAIGGRSSLGAVWFFSPGRGAASIVLGAARLALAAGHYAVIEPPITIGGSWVIYVS